MVRRRATTPDWRTPVDGRAPRLGPRTTISVAPGLGPWRGRDPSRPFEGWRRPARWPGVGLWAGVVGGAAALGWRKGRGPLRSIGLLRELGSALPGDALDDASLAVDDREAWIG